MSTKNSFLGKYKRAAKYYWYKIIRTKASSHSVAMGLACGVFAGCLPALPPVPLQTSVAFVLALVLRGSKVPAVLATWVSNPFNWILFYLMEYKIGTFFLGLDIPFDPTEWEKVSDFLQLGWKVIAVLMTGGIIMGVPSAIITYAIALPMIRNYRNKRSLRRLKKQQDM